MTAQIIDGKAIAAALRADIGRRIAARVQAGRRAPGLSVILVGDNPASEIYVRNKHKACEEAGIRSQVLKHPAALSQAGLLAEIEALNADDAVDGILVQ